MSLTLRLKLIVSDTYCWTYVSHPPREMQETWRPERPRKRYSIFGRSLGASDGEDMAAAMAAGCLQYLGRVRRIHVCKMRSAVATTKVGRIDAFRLLAAPQSALQASCCLIRKEATQHFSQHSDPRASPQPISPTLTTRLEDNIVRVDSSLVSTLSSLLFEVL